MNEWESGLWIWLSGLLFAVVHSLLASQSCKQWSYKHGLKEPRYRLVYSVFSVLTTAVWVWFVHQLADASLYQTDGFIWLVMVALQVLGLIVALAAFQPIDGLVFLGLRKASTGTDPFIVSGIYRWVRHPMYSGAMLILLAMPEQSYNGLHFSLVICVYFIIGSRFEEKRMLQEHPAYVNYQASVAAFVPWITKR
jgi:protein-S-isoprenylcysteine O-methyltransferase Ste14